MKIQTWWGGVSGGGADGGGGCGLGIGGVGGGGVGDGGGEFLRLALELKFQTVFAWTNMVKIGIVDVWKWQSVFIGGGGFSVIIEPPKLILCLIWVWPN